MTWLPRNRPPRRSESAEGKYRARARRSTGTLGDSKLAGLNDRIQMALGSTDLQYWGYQGKENLYRSSQCHPHRMIFSFMVSMCALNLNLRMIELILRRRGYPRNRYR